jgi:thymidylate synthase ThyX
VYYSYRAKVILDSVSPYTGVRLTTMSVTFPKFILQEVNTHRVFSRNASSSRALTVEKCVDNVMKYPVIPVYFGGKKKGMTDAGIDKVDQQVAKQTWLSARDAAVLHARKLDEIGVHKEWANRVIEPYMWCTMVVSSTSWLNFFKLRTHADTQPEFRQIAQMMHRAMGQSVPTIRYIHLPFVIEQDTNNVRGECTDYGTVALIKISAARCARASYEVSEGKVDPQADLSLYERLVGDEPVHASPTEHPAMAMQRRGWSGNFYCWKQHRKTIPGESGGDVIQDG